MGYYKNLLIDIQELVGTALETGASDIDSVYAYVYMHQPEASRAIVEDILDEIYRDSEAEYFWSTNPGHA